MDAKVFVAGASGSQAVAGPPSSIIPVCVKRKFSGSNKFDFLFLN